MNWRLLLQRWIEVPAELAELGVVCRDVLNRTEAVRELVLVRPRPRQIGQLMILWNDADNPGFYSVAFELERGPQTVRSDGIHYPIPAGAWVVAVGCTMSQVFVGVNLQDVGSGIAGVPLRVVRLRDAVGVGVVLRAQVTPDP